MSDDSDEAKLLVDANEARTILSEAHRVTMDRLPKHIQDAVRWAGKRAKEQSGHRKAEKSERVKRMLEHLCTGHARIEIAKAMGVSNSVVTYALKPVWPFDAPGQDYRYFIAKLSPDHLDALDELCRDTLLPRTRMVEDILQACLECNATVARRTLAVKRKNP